MENIIYKLYTIAELRDFVLHNKEIVGLSYTLITRTRAYALLNNPHAKDADVVVAAVFVDNSPIGYTAIFPENFTKPDLQKTYYWGSTEWLEPEYRGKGISALMMRNLKNAIQNRYLGLDSTIASIKLDQKQGSEITYYPRYFFYLDKKKCQGIRSILKKNYVSIWNKNVLKKTALYDYTNEYVNFIDDQTYAFIVAHSTNDLFLKKREVLNWQLSNSFVLPIGNDDRTTKELCAFGSYVKDSWFKAVKVYVDHCLVGFYVIKCTNGICELKYLYYEESFYKNVFASVLRNILQSNVIEFKTFSKALYEFICHLGMKSINSHCIEQVALTAPPGWLKDSSLYIQGGDGDMFC